MPCFPPPRPDETTHRHHNVANAPPVQGSRATSSRPAPSPPRPGVARADHRLHSRFLAKRGRLLHALTLLLHCRLRRTPRIAGSGHFRPTIPQQADHHLRPPLWSTRKVSNRLAADLTRPVRHRSPACDGPIAPSTTSSTRRGELAGLPSGRTRRPPKTRGGPLSRPLPPSRARPIHLCIYLVVVISIACIASFALAHLVAVTLVEFARVSDCAQVASLRSVFQAGVFFLKAASEAARVVEFAHEAAADEPPAASLAPASHACLLLRLLRRDELERRSCERRTVRAGPRNPNPKTSRGVQRSEASQKSAFNAFDVLKFLSRRSSSHTAPAFP